MNTDRRKRNRSTENTALDLPLPPKYHSAWKHPHSEIETALDLCTLFALIGLWAENQ